MSLVNGYYLSVYSQIDSFLHYKQASYRHDHSISLWKKNAEKIELVHHWELERRTGLKHHHVSFPSQEDFMLYVSQLLSQYNLCLGDIVHIFGTPNISNVEGYQNNTIEVPTSYHAIAHLFSSLAMDSDVLYNENILGIAYDGGSDSVVDLDVHERYQYLGCYSKKGEITYFPIYSPGFYWTSMKSRFGMEEGSLMALATASSSKLLEKVYDDMEIINVYKKADRKLADVFVNRIVEKVFEYSVKDQGVKFNYYDERFTEEENKISMVMKVIFQISFFQVDYMIDDAIKRFKINPEDTCIAIAGGYALNCPTNTHIMQKYKFKKQLIAPCTNDSGQSIGMGLYYFFSKSDQIHFKLGHPYYGDCDYHTDDILCMDKYIKYIDSYEDTLKHIAIDLVENPVVWFNERAEIGPRALGGRSILADPRSMRSKDLLNQYKQRQWWRPVAPLILADHLAQWFQEAYDSPFMLNNFTVFKEKKALVPAILHIDNTARVQTLTEEFNPRLYNAVSQFYQKTGIPIVCNTSLNDRGEPIINTLEEALVFALRKGIEIVYLNGARVKLKKHALYKGTTPLARVLLSAFFGGTISHRQWRSRIISCRQGEVKRTAIPLPPMPNQICGRFPKAPQVAEPSFEELCLRGERMYNRGCTDRSCNQLARIPRCCSISARMLLT